MSFIKAVSILGATLGCVIFDSSDVGSEASDVTHTQLARQTTAPIVQKVLLGWTGFKARIVKFREKMLPLIVPKSNPINAGNHFTSSVGCQGLRESLGSVFGFEKPATISGMTELQFPYLDVGKAMASLVS